MTSGIDTIFAPRTFAQARTLRTKILGRHLRRATRRLRHALLALWSRLAHAWQYQRELELLMHADERMLADIGLTRYDVVTAAQGSRGWLGRRDALQSAAIQRDEAAALASARRAGLPLSAAPPLAPALPHALETSNFR